MRRSRSTILSPRMLTLRTETAHWSLVAITFIRSVPFLAKLLFGHSEPYLKLPFSLVFSPAVQYTIQAFQKLPKQFCFIVIMYASTLSLISLLILHRLVASATEVQAVLGGAASQYGYNGPGVYQIYSYTSSLPIGTAPDNGIVSLYGYQCPYFASHLFTCGLTHEM